MVRVPAPSPRSPVLVVVLAVLVVGAALVSSNLTPAGILASPSPGPSARASLTADATFTPGPTGTPFPTPPYTAAPTCDLPGALPAPPPSVATPAIRSSVSMVFASPFYRGTGPAMAPGGPGLWSYTAGATAPRLLAGMDASDGPDFVLPLALSADGEVAAIWWQPRQYAANAAPCPVGLYLASTGTGASRLVTSDAWSGWGVGPDPQSDCSIGSDGQGGISNRLRGVSFSADGRWLAVVECARIRIFGPDPTEPPLEHVGVCDQWAWSPASAAETRFVASCEDMTSAWFVDAHDAGGSQTSSLALPLPSGGFGWGYPGPGSRAIGMTAAGTIRVVRFFGAAIGCETLGCSIPPFAGAVTTIEPWDADAKPVTTSATIDFLVESTRLSPDAGWAYVETDASGPRLVNLATNTVTKVGSIGRPAGTPADGTRLFGSGLDGRRNLVVLWSLDAAGTRREVATIAWPASLPPDFGGEDIVSVIGIQVATPS